MYFMNNSSEPELFERDDELAQLYDSVGVVIQSGNYRIEQIEPLQLHLLPPFLLEL